MNAKTEINAVSTEFLVKPTRPARSRRPNATPPDDICGTEYDIARAQWGDGWRLPSQTEFQELVDNCTWEWTEVNGVAGCRATVANGNAIFFPAAASRDGETVSKQVGQRGCYWSGTLYGGNAHYAYYFYFL